MLSLGGIGIALPFRREAHPRRRSSHSDAALRRANFIDAAVARSLCRLRTLGLQRDYIWMQTTGNLFGQRIVIWRKQAGIQGSLDRGNPLVMEIMKDAGIDARPIVDRHG